MHIKIYLQLTSLVMTHRGRKKQFEYLKNENIFSNETKSTVHNFLRTFCSLNIDK